ncbi:MAG: molecular chaperone [Sphaerochaetaceae bacterium]|jgi:fimbrial chaperone protein|nr:molecular chaperone [Sphaerochaetaceae bacterium]
MMNKRVIALITVLCLAASSLVAFQFSPLEQTFSTSGAESTKSYTIVNDSNDSIAIVITALTRDQDGDGNELNESASSYFSIVPAKVIVKPQSTQIVRVQYKGPKTVTTELSFRIRAEQTTYSQGRQQTEGSMFNFLYIYTTSAYVSPSAIVERVGIRSITPALDEEGNKIMKIAVANAGNIHQILTGAEITITDSANNRVILSGTEQIGRISGLNLLAKKTVTVSVPWPEGLPYPEGQGSFKATIDYSK